MADWEEVRRLAKDLQRLQAVSTVHRLSERNCIELVNRLAEMGLVEVIYTLDGKAYVTPQRLEREIRSELMAHRGRINVVDLQQLLNVDLSHIEGRVGDLLRNDRSLLLLQGELIDSGCFLTQGSASFSAYWSSDVDTLFHDLKRLPCTH